MRTLPMLAVVVPILPLLPLAAIAGAEDAPAAAPFTVRLAGVRVATLHDAELDPEAPVNGWRLRNQGLDGDSRIVLRLVAREPWVIVASTPVELLEAALDDGDALQPAPPPVFAFDKPGRQPLDGSPELPFLGVARFVVPTRPAMRVRRLIVRFDVRYADGSATTRATWPLAAEPVRVVAGDALRFAAIAGGGVGVDEAGDVVDRVRRVDYLGDDGDACHVTQSMSRFAQGVETRRLELSFDRPATSVVVETFAAIRATRVEATFTDVPLIGRGESPAPPTVTFADLPEPSIPAAATPAKAEVKVPSDF